MSEQMILTFPHGLVGCERWRRFVLVESPPGPVHQLLSMDEPGVAFLVAEPQVMLPGYRVELTEADVELLGHHGPADIQLLCTLTLNETPPRVTANLLGPLVINRAVGIGKQVVLVESGYSPRHPVLAELPERVDARTH